MNAKKMIEREVDGDECDKDKLHREIDRDTVS
jgi:hypothetical protein